MAAVLADENNRPRYAVLRHALIGVNSLASRRTKRHALRSDEVIRFRERVFRAEC